MPFPLRAATATVNLARASFPELTRHDGRPREMDGFIFVKDKSTDVGFNRKGEKTIPRVIEKQWEGEERAVQRCTRTSNIYKALKNNASGS